MIQLILHLIGDYVTQSDWMANNKTKRHWPAFVHAVVYSLPFLLLRPSWAAFAVILGTHFLIDRYRLAVKVVKWKNIIGDADFYQMHNLDIRTKLVPKFSTGTGYPEGTPPFLAVWLLIAADNTLHIAINYLALRYL